MSKNFLLLISLSLLSLLSLSLSLSVEDIANDVLSAMDPSVDPCTDFYAYSCGGWIKNQTLSPDESVLIKAFSSIGKINDQILQEIINETTHPRVHQFFGACMNTARINAQGVAPLIPYWNFMNSIKTPADFAIAVAMQHQLGFSPLFQLTIDIDPENPPYNIIQLQQSGLGLPDPSYYSSPSLLNSYVTHITNMMILVGENPDDAAKIAQTVVNFESALSGFTVPGNNMTDPFALYNPVDSKGLIALCPGFSWTYYFSALTSNTSYGIINVITPSYFQALSGFLFSMPISTLSNYLKWMLVHNFAPILTDKFVTENFNFYGKILGGLQQPAPRWRSCVSAVDGDLGDLLGVYFAKKAFGGKSKEVAQQMVSAIEAAMTSRLQTIAWMDNQTRAKALQKISLVGNYIGYPDHIRNISFQLTDDYFTNYVASTKYSFFQSLGRIGKPADKAIWSMTADTINAYYDPTRNEMVFPAAILQAPYFDVSRPPAMNFGGGGMIMGHELTHGFDSSGKDYDGNGKLTNWWQPGTSQQFNDKVQCVINQYSQFEVLPGVFIDGKLTQGENVADMGGIKNSYDAYLSLYGPEANQPSIVPGLTNIQLFFVAYGQGWCGVARPEYLKNQVKTDPHSWARFRTLGPLMNFPSFAKTFSCPSGSYMNPTNRCEVW